MKLEVDVLSETLFANQYFREELKKIHVRRDYVIRPLSERCEDVGGGRCYFLTAWALLGLKASDYLIRGTIDLPERDGWKASKNYRHGWVRFVYRENSYIYDPLYRHVFPVAAWEEIHAPRAITFEKTQAEILTELLCEQYAYAVGDDNRLWQLKSYKQLPEVWRERDSGFLSDTLAEAQIHYAYGTCTFALVVDHS